VGRGVGECVEVCVGELRCGLVWAEVWDSVRSERDTDRTRQRKSR
jgi:hypothetical protein